MVNLFLIDDYGFGFVFSTATFRHGHPQASCQLLYQLALVSDSGPYDGLDLKLFNLVGTGAFVCSLVHRCSTDGLLLRFQVMFLAVQGSASVTQHVVSVESLSYKTMMYLLTVMIRGRV